MEYSDLAAIAGFAFLYSLVASRLERSRLNGALVYVLAGFACGPHGLGWVNLQVGGEALKTLAELTLALVLFTDSAGTNLATLRRIRQIPIRLLAIGLPLTVLAGGLLGHLVFPELGVFEVALLATILAPTDAALGKAVVTNRVVPETVRGSLNVESGLNDGICVPVLLFFLALVTGDSESTHAAELMAKLSFEAIGIGALVGVAGGYLGSRMLRSASAGRWMGRAWMQIPVIALALLCFATAQTLEGSGFIACFVAGLVFAAVETGQKEDFLDAAEGVGNSMALVTWFAIGGATIGLTWEHLDARIVLYAALSLTVVRILPVILSLAGLGLRTDTRLFMGWFGPRGLASIVFMVLVHDQAIAGDRILVPTVTVTILLSVLLHGLSANPLAQKYGDRIAQNHEVI